MILALKPCLWEKLKTRITAPHFSHTKKVGLLHYDGSIPSVLNTDVKVLGKKHMYDGLVIKTKDQMNNLNLVQLFPERCTSCMGTDIRSRRSEGVKICRCGNIMTDASDADSSFQQSYGQAHSHHVGVKKDRPRKNSNNTYKRCNHFKYWLARLQGKERSKVTNIEIHQIKTQMIRMHLSCESLRLDQLKYLLKKLKMQRYYNNVHSIYYIITGKRFMYLKPYHEQKLMDLFLLIQEAFNSKCGKRVNMLSYLYLIKKFSEILGWTRIAKSLPLLKSQQKIKQQDEIWKKICSFTGLPFKRSIA